MREEELPIKIVIPVEEEPPLVPDRPPTGSGDRLRHKSRRMIKQAGRGINRAWRSDALKAATRRLGRGVTKVVSGSGRFVQKTVFRRVRGQARRQIASTQMRLQTTNWKREARARTAGGLHWLSLKSAQLAQRLTPGKDNDAGRNTEP